MIRYIQQIEEAFKDEVEESRTVKKPEKDSKHKVVKAMVRDPKNPKRLIKGWKKELKHKGQGVKNKAKKKIAAIKAWKKRKQSAAGMRKAAKKAKITRKKSKQAGLTK